MTAILFLSFLSIPNNELVEKNLELKQIHNELIKTASNNYRSYRESPKPSTYNVFSLLFKE